MQNQSFVRYVSPQDVIAKYQITPLPSNYGQQLHNYLLLRFLQEFENFDMSFELIERANGGISYIEEIAFNFGNFQSATSDCYSKVCYHLECFGEDFLNEIEPPETF
jgi:hypothetical protein